jgi:hypothetical protein
MRSQRVVPRARIAAVVAALAVLALLPARAAASHLNGSIVVSIGSPIALVNGVYLRVPVQATCPALQPPLAAIFSDQISVSVDQKTGRSLALGGGGIFYQSPAANGVGVGTPVTCDGTAHTYTVNVLPATPQSGPFHGGPAVASSQFSLTVFDSTNPCVFCTADSNFTSGGLHSVSIRGG